MTFQVEADGYYTKIRPFVVKDYGKFLPKLTYIEIKLLNSSVPTTPTTTTTMRTTTTQKHVFKNIVTDVAYSFSQKPRAESEIVLPQIVSKIGELEEPFVVPIRSNSRRTMGSRLFIVLWLIMMLMRC